jgi:hypothetical protein
MMGLVVLPLNPWIVPVSLENQEGPGDLVSLPSRPSFELDTLARVEPYPKMGGSLARHHTSSMLVTTKLVNDYKTKKQKKGRNILSNIFRSFLKFIVGREFMSELFEQLHNNLSRSEFEEQVHR